MMEVMYLVRVYDNEDNLLYQITDSVLPRAKEIAEKFLISSQDSRVVLNKILIAEEV